MIKEFLRTLGQVVAYSWALRRPFFLLFVVVVGLVALLGAAGGLLIPVAVYPLL